MWNYVKINGSLLRKDFPLSGDSLVLYVRHQLDLHNNRANIGVPERGNGQFEIESVYLFGMNWFGEHLLLQVPIS